jgi:predicted dehydrogenase
MSEKEVRIGIIGLGNMGSTHARWLGPEKKVSRCRLTAVCDLDPAKLAAYEGVSRFEDSAKLIRSGEVDAVLIATPHYFHTSIGIDALGQGLHVLTEKPLSVHKNDCVKLIKAHTNPKQIFSAMFQMRTEPVYKKIRSLLQQGELGQLSRVSWIITDWFRSEAYYASGGWRATWAGEGGGVLLNQCPHNLDLICWLFGQPTKVNASCLFGRRHDIEVEDEVTAMLEFKGGATGIFATSTGEAPGTNRLEIAGDRGKLVMEEGKLTFFRNEIPTSQFSKETRESFAMPDHWRATVPTPGAPGSHLVITQNFVDAILDGKPLLAPAEEGLASVELANAMLYSSHLGKAVDLPLDGDGYERLLKERIASSKFVKKSTDVKSGDFSKSFK